MSVAIIDYNAGNLTSVARALAHLGVDAAITDDPDKLRHASRVIFPGVGAAASCMQQLKAAGMDQALRETVASGKPVLGICVGMQLLFRHSDEDGGVDCVGLLPGRVKRFQPVNRQIKVPHMGWNPVRLFDPVLRKDIPEQSCFYFVHSYYCAPDQDPRTQVVAECEHGHTFCAGIRRQNLVAVQFHPEKSGMVGLQLLKNFLAE
jgi:imidazole glycerol-phosphate synthase subunit HisH